MAFDIEEVWAAKAVLGEGATWSTFDDALYWVDIHQGHLHRFTPEGARKDSWTLPTKVGCVIPDGKNTLIAALANGFARITVGLPGAPPMIRWIADPEADLPENRFNDGKRAPDGSVWAGTMHDPETRTSGNWWRLGLDESIQKLNASPFKVTNGPAFDRERARVFLTDSAIQRVFVADLMEEGTGYGALSTYLQFGEGDGYPDGMSLDAEGNLWIAFWEGSCIRKFDPDGVLQQQVDLPVLRPTTVTFAPNGDLYVTSAGLHENQKFAGSLMRIRAR